jgi:hypothetical protein
MIVHEQSVSRLRRQIALALILKQSLIAVTAWAFLWGTVVLVLRAALGTSPLLLAWGLLGAPVLAGLLAARALRRLPSRSAVRALLDRAGGCGGLLMAAEELPLGDWRPSPRPADLRVRWHAGRSWFFLAAGCAYLVAGLLLPERLTSMSHGHALQVDKEVEQLAAQIDVLKEQAILEPARAETLKEKLGELKKGASGEDPAKTLEALDHLQNLTSRAAKEAAEAALQKTEDLARAETLAEGLRKSSKDLADKTRAEAMDELARLMKKAAREKALADKFLGPKERKDYEARVLTRKKLEKRAAEFKGSKEELARLMEKLRKAGLLSGEELKKLARAMRLSKGELARLMKELRKARLIDEETLKKLAEAGKGDPAKLAELLKKLGGIRALAELVKVCTGAASREGGAPGRGGVDEGGGETPLTWKKKSTEEGVKFKEELLPPGDLAGMKKSVVIGLSKSRPEREKGGAGQPGALGRAAAGGGSAQTPVILPRHRGAVRRYFDRASEK